MSPERQRLRPWLEDRINSGEVPGLRWLDPEKTKFRVTWKHAGKPDFNLETDAVLFRMWAEHTGKYKRGEQPDPSTWKTRFRCALHKMPDIEEIRIPHSLDENEPFRVFRLKPKVTTSKPRRHSINNHKFPTLPPYNSTPPLDFSHPPPYMRNGFHGNMTKSTIPMSDLWSSLPPISGHMSTHTNSNDFSSIMLEDIDRITPTIPPIPLSFSFDQSVDHFKQQQPAPALNDDFFNNNDQYSTYEPTLTELHSVSRGEQFSYSGGGISDGMSYNNNMTYNMVGNACQNMVYHGLNGPNPGHQMGHAKMFHIPTDVVQEMVDPTISNLSSDFVSSTMEYSTSSTETQSFALAPVGKDNEEALDNITNQIQTMTMNKTENIWSCRVYYHNKEVSTFELSSKQTCRITYQKPENQAHDSSLNRSGKVVLLPESPSSDKDIQAVLERFNNGLIIEMMLNGVTWVTKTCQSKVYLSRGAENITKLPYEVRTEVFEEWKSNNKTFVLSLSEEPHEALVKLVFLPVHERTMEQKPCLLQGIYPSQL